MVELVDPARVPSAADRWARVQGARALAAATPWTAAVALALDLEGYDPVPGWIARRLGIPPELEAECLRLLVDAGVVAERDGRYVRGPLNAVETRPAQLRSFWAGVARERLDAGAPGVHAWNLGVVSSADLVRIEEVQRQAFRTIRAIVAASAPAERLVLLSWSLAPLD